MLQYNWPAWVDRVSSSPRKWALERWLLMYLHEQQNVDRLALALMERLMVDNPNVQIRVQSMWVDGTPQAAFSPEDHPPQEKRPQCELADLLLCVRLESPNGQLQREQAMLIQAKVTIDHDELPGGDSTKTERLLFEHCDRNQDITLYPGSGRENPIGNYKLGDYSGTQSYGLHDCARFLLMAKKRWGKVGQAFAPLQVGWPLFHREKQIFPPQPFLDAVMCMVSEGTWKLGREVKTRGSSSCAWSQMVNDLQGKYLPVTMDGYNRQPRVRTSATTVKSPYLILSVLSESRNSSFMANEQWEKWYWLNVPYLRFPTGWARLKHCFKQLLFLRSRWGLQEKLENLRKLDVGGFEGIKLWSDNPNAPPPSDSIVNDGNGPHISTLVVTIRGLEQERRPD